MEDQIEKLLLVLMAKVNDGIPDGNGGYLEEPVENYAMRLREESNGQLDAAVDVAAYEIIVSRSKWSSKMWKGVLLVLVGQVPLVGSATAVFYSQFEAIWKQLRFVSVAASLYGHDTRDDHTQCQIVLCLLDDKIREKEGRSAMQNIYSKGVKSGVSVAATVVARSIVQRGGSRFLLRRVLGGLLVGVVPEAVGVLYTVWGGGSRHNEAEALEQAKLLTRRVQRHFKREEQVTLWPFWLALVLWGVPVLVKALIKLWIAYDKAWEKGRAFSSDRAPWLALEPLQIDWLPDAVYTISYLALKACVGFSLVWCIFRVYLSVGKRKPWTFSATVVLARSILLGLSAESTAQSAVLALLGPETERLYHTHRAGVGLITLISSQKEVKIYAIGSLAANVVLTILWAIFVHGQGDSINWHSLLESITSLSNLVLVELLKKPDTLLALVGPKRVLRSILIAARSIGHAVSRPSMVMEWLHIITPPYSVSCVLFSVQRSAAIVGLFWGTGYVSKVNIVLLAYCSGCTTWIMLSRAFLPHPRTETWEEVLRTKMRLLYLLQLDTSVQDRLDTAIHFFEEYESFTRSRSKEFISVKDWVSSNFTPKEKSELETLGNDPKVEMDMDMYRKREGSRWWFWRKEVEVTDEIRGESDAKHQETVVVSAGDSENSGSSWWFQRKSVATTVTDSTGNVVEDATVSETRKWTSDGESSTSNDNVEQKSWRWRLWSRTSEGPSPTTSALEAPNSASSEPTVPSWKFWGRNSNGSDSPNNAEGRPQQELEQGPKPPTTQSGQSTEEKLEEEEGEGEGGKVKVGHKGADKMQNENGEVGATLETCTTLDESSRPPVMLGTEETPREDTEKTQEAILDPVESETQEGNDVTESTGEGASSLDDRAFSEKKSGESTRQGFFSKLWGSKGSENQQREPQEITIAANDQTSTQIEEVHALEEESEQSPEPSSHSTWKFWAKAPIVEPENSELEHEGGVNEATPQQSRWRFWA